MIVEITAVFTPLVDMTFLQFLRVGATPLGFWLKVRDSCHADRIYVKLKGAAHIHTI